MEGLFGFIVFVVSIIGVVSKVQGKAKGRRRSVPQTVWPVEAPEAPLQEEPEQPQVDRAEQPAIAPMDQAHGEIKQMKPPLAEGESRSCEHGTLGGSMAIEQHEGDPLKKPVKALPMQNAAISRPKVSAQEMQRAVVMAEILKRPSERRWRYAGR